MNPATSEEQGLRHRASAATVGPARRAEPTVHILPNTTWVGVGA
jgi:hypothetical protein